MSGGFVRANRAVGRTRRRRTAALAALTLAVVAAVALPSVVLSHLPVEVRRAGEWRYSHEVKLATGWKLLSRSIDPEVETTVLQVPSGADDPADCTVLVRVAGVLPDLPSSRVDAATVRGRPAKIATRPGDTVNVYWEYAPGAWASVECDSQVPLRREAMVGIAEAVRFHDVRQALPYTLTALPEGYRIRTVGETFAPLYGDVVWGPTVLLEPPADSYWAAVIVGPDLADARGRLVRDHRELSGSGPIALRVRVPDGRPGGAEPGHVAPDRGDDARPPPTGRRPQRSLDLVRREHAARLIARSREPLTPRCPQSTNRGTVISAAVSEPCIPTRDSSRGNCRVITAQSVRMATST